MLLLWLGLAARAGSLAVVIDGPDAPSPLIEGLRSELGLLNLDLTVEPDDVYTGEATEARLAASLQEALRDRDTTAIVTLGPLASAVTRTLSRPRVPVVAALDLIDAPTPTGVWPLSLDVDLERAREIVEQLTGADAVIVGAPELVARGLMPADTLPATRTLELPDGVKGAVVLPLTTVPPSDRPGYFAGWTEQGIATVALQGDLSLGATGSLRTPKGINTVLRRIALVLSDLLSGRPPSVQTLELRTTELQLSAEALAKLNLSPPFTLLAEADIVGWQDLWPVLTLEDAVTEAIRASPDLSGTRASLSADDTAVGQSIAAWLPAATASVSATQLDPNSVSAIQADRFVTGSLTFDQLLFSDAAVVNVNAQQDLRRARSAELSVAEQDLAFNVASTYVGVLRTEALLEVRRADLDRMRESLRIALQRQAVGDVAATEVARWQSEVANARTNLVVAWADFQSAQITLQQLLGGDTSVRVRTVPIEGALEDLAEVLTSPRDVERVSTALATFSQENAPSLDQVDGIVRSQERFTAQQRRQYWMPSVGAQFAIDANIVQDFSNSGDTGTGTPTGTPTGAGALDFSSFAVDLPPFTWSLGASVTLPLFEGGGLRASQREFERDLASLNHQRETLRQSVVARSRDAINQAIAASLRAELGQVQVEAVQRTLEATLDAYARGATTQTTVTEARSSALNAEVSATNAAYDAVQAVFDMLYVAGALPTPNQPEAPEQLRAALIAGINSMETP